MFFVKLMFLPMMIKVLSKTHRPFLCAFLYMALIFTNGLMFDLAFGGTWQSVGVQCAIALGGSALWFWLLEEFDGADGIYWPIFGVGLCAMLFIPWW